MKHGMAVVGIFIICFSLLLSGCAQSRISQVDGNIVTDGCQTPSDIVRVGNKLYFNYYTDSYKTSGTFEITSEGSQLYKEAREGTPEDTPILDDMLAYKDALFDEVTEGTDISSGISTQYMTVDGTLYKVCYEENSGSSVYVYSDDNFKKLVDVEDKILAWYMHGDKLYYITADENDYQEYSNYRLVKCDISKNATEKLKDLSTDYDGEYVESMAVDGEKIFILTDISYTQAISENAVELQQKKTLTVESINSNESSKVAGAADVDIAYSGGTVYYCASDGDGRGVYKYGDNPEKLSDAAASEIAVFDDKYVYFVKDENTLCRVTQDGKSEETVFG